jgi:hypothetical protein
MSPGDSDFHITRTAPCSCPERLFGKIIYLQAAELRGIAVFDFTIPLSYSGCRPCRNVSGH